MNLLLDTHVFLWWMEDSPRLSAAQRAAITDPHNRLSLSAGSVWEIVIKQQVGKLTAPEPLDQTVPQALTGNNIALLPIDLRHLFAVRQLPLHHRDPFDRLLIAQAVTESLTILTVDAAFHAYRIPVIG